MTYAISSALQTFIYQTLSNDPALNGLVSTNVFDTPPDGQPTTTYVVLGPETVKDRSDLTGNGAIHDVVVRVVAPQDGFKSAKDVAAVICDALLPLGGNLDRGRLLSINFLTARAKRTDAGSARQIDLRFRARVSDD